MMLGIRALAVEGTKGAFGVREKPPRGGQERKIQECNRRGNLRRRERQGGAFAAIERAGGKGTSFEVSNRVPGGTLFRSIFGTAEGREHRTDRIGFQKCPRCRGEFPRRRSHEPGAERGWQ